MEASVLERFAGAGVPAANVATARETYMFQLDAPPAPFLERFRNFYGPTMNAFEAAAKNGKEADLQRELEALFAAQNRSGSPDRTAIPATYLRVTVTKP